MPVKGGVDVKLDVALATFIYCSHIRACDHIQRHLLEVGRHEHMRQVAHVLPHLIQIAFGMAGVGGKQQFGSQNIVAHAVMQLLGYTLALVFQSADVALTLLKRGPLGSQPPAVEQCAQQPQQRYREHHKAEHLIGKFRLLAFRLGQCLLCLQCLVFHRKLTHAPLYITLLHRVQ